MGSTSVDAVVAGHICLDIIPDLSKIPPGSLLTSFRSGGLLTIGKAKVATGGPVSNTGLALHILGISTRLMGKIGNDMFGSAVLEVVRSYHPDLAEGMVIDESVPTSYSFVINPPDMDRFFMHCPGANEAFGVEDIKYEQLEQARLFHFGYPPIMRLMYANDGEQLVEVYRRAKLTGVTTSLDTCTPDPLSASGQADWKKILRTTLPYVDIFLPSIEELLYMLRKEFYMKMLDRSQNGDILPQVTPELLSEVSSELQDMGAKIVGIKTGYRGMYLRTGGKNDLVNMGRSAPADLDAWENREIWAPVFNVNVVGTTGSGDSTIAGFLSAVLRGFGAAQAIVAATAVGACNVEAADSLGGLRSWDATMQRIGAGWQRQESKLDSPGWTFDKEKQFWFKTA